VQDRLQVLGGLTSWKPDRFLPAAWRQDPDRPAPLYRFCRLEQAFAWELPAIARVQDDVPAAERWLAAAHQRAEMQTADGPRDCATTAWASMSEAYAEAGELDEAPARARRSPKYLLRIYGHVYLEII
jgi:hypothetical protein